MAWTNSSLSDLPKVHDVMWCRISFRRAPGVPADPPHPIIVRHVERDDTAGEAIIHCIYGTSNLKDRDGIDLVLRRPIEYVAHGLYEPTRFDLADDNTIPCLWTRSIFQTITQ